MSKKVYSAPRFDLVSFESEDILMASQTLGDCTGEDIDWDGAGDTDDKFWENWDLF